MGHLRIQSIKSPFDDPRVTVAALGALTRADAMGLLSAAVTCLDEDALRDLATGMAAAGIGLHLLVEFNRLSGRAADEILTLLQRVNEALDDSPAPAQEWQTLQAILGLELLARFLRISGSSVRRYLSGARTTPDPVAIRLHFLALLVGDLAGAYSDIGVRSWFDRPRALLAGRAPARLFDDDWRPDDDGPKRVRALARTLWSPPEE